MLIRFLRWCEIPQPYFPGDVLEVSEERARSLMEGLPAGAIEIAEPGTIAKAKPEPEPEEREEYRPTIKNRMAKGLIKG